MGILVKTNSFMALFMHFIFTKTKFLIITFLILLTITFSLKDAIVYLTSVWCCTKVA